jgi:hypothetical protein
VQERESASKLVDPSIDRVREQTVGPQRWLFSMPPSRDCVPRTPGGILFICLAFAESAALLTTIIAQFVLGGDGSVNALLAA